MSDVKNQNRMTLHVEVDSRGKVILPQKIADGLYQQERERVLGLFDLYFGRVLKAKGKNWRAEFERFRAEVEAGHQQIEFEPEPKPEIVLASGVSEKGRELYVMYEKRFGRKTQE